MSQTSLRLRVVPRYPAKVTATDGLKAVRTGVDLVVKSDYGNLVQVPSVSNPDRTFMLAWDADIDNYQSMSFTNIINNIQDAVIGPPLAAIDATNPGANQVIYFTDVGVASTFTASNFVRGISNSPDQSSFVTAAGAATATQGAKADVLSAALPTAASNIQGSGLNGINGGTFFAYDAPAAFTSNPGIRVQRNIFNSTGGGVSGNTYKALWVLTRTNPSSPGYEWAGTFEQHNQTSGTAGAENVALNSTAFLEANGISEIGSTWGGNFVVDDREAVVNPHYPRIGVEIDNFVLKTGGTDNNRNRVVAQLAFGATDGTPDPGTPLHIGRGILVGANQANVILDRLMEVAGAGTYGIGIDTTKVTFSGPVLMMGQGQAIAFDGASNGAFNRSLYWLTGSLAYKTNLGVVMSITDAGLMTITGGLGINGALSVAGTQVLGVRRTGWAADTGTAKRTANATYSGTAEAAYTQATIQTLMNAVRDLSQTVKALKDDLIAHGLIGT